MSVLSSAQHPTPSAQRLLGLREGTAPGPTLIIVGGLHGNEPSGLVASERVLRALDDTPLDRGRLVCVRGNTAALSVEASAPWLRPRYLDADLNRLFTDEDEDTPSPRVEDAERRALERALADLVRESDGPCYFMDLHTVSSDSPPFVAVEDALPARRFAMRFPLPKILGMEEELRGLLMDHATNRLGCVSVIVEAGRHDDPHSVDIHEAAIWIALDTAGVTALGPRRIDGRDPRRVLRDAARGRHDHVYDVRHRTPIRSEDFMIHAGATAFARVREGRDRIAIENGGEIIAPVTGLLFMPNRQPRVRPGDDAFFIVKRVRRGWLSLSALLRSRPLVHAWLPRLLPGVRARPGHPNHILLAPEIAAVLRHEVMHLFGYRVIRRTPAPRLTAAQRWLQGARGVARSIGTIALGIFRGGERAALPGERPEDWIARRHTLDLPPNPHSSTPTTEPDRP